MPAEICVPDSRPPEATGLASAALPAARGVAWFEATPVDWRLRAKRSLGVAAVWGVAAIPVLRGWQKCAMATLLHVPCPGCGMTRAIRLLEAGRVEASLQMHPMAVPVLMAGLLFMAATVGSTLGRGTPFLVHKTLLGRVAIAFALVVYAATFALWIARWLGYFGGPVPVA